MAGSSGSDIESDRELGETALVSSTSNWKGAGRNPFTVNLTDLNILDCPICGLSLLPPVYQCKNGHIACVPCCTEIEYRCPTCRRYVGIRNRVLEKVIESVTVECRNSFYGCSEIFYPNMELAKLNHEKLCCYSLCTCPFDNCIYVGMSESLYKHFGEEHSPSIFSLDTATSISMDAGQTRVFLQDSSHCTLFILERTISPQGSFVSLARVGSQFPGIDLDLNYCLKAVIDRSISVEIKAGVECVEEWTTGSVLRSSLLLPSSMVDEREKLTLELVIWRYSEY